MNATIKSSKATKGLRSLPAIPFPRPMARHDEVKEIEAFIRTAGGKPMTRATKKRLLQAGCSGFPQD